jgi:hypothetical protein
MEESKKRVAEILEKLAGVRTELSSVLEKEIGADVAKCISDVEMLVQCAAKQGAFKNFKPKLRELN